MKTGIELIAEEHSEIINKHGYDINFILSNPQYYLEGQMAQAASHLISIQWDNGFNESDLEMMPENWDADEYRHMLLKTYKERLIIAGALIANEIDRLQAI